MKRNLFVLLLVLIAFTPGCWIFFIDQPSSVDEGESVSIDVAMHADLNIADINTHVFAPVWCGAFPQNWDVLDFSYSFRSSFMSSAEPEVLEFLPTESASMNSDRPVSTAGLLSSWNCFAGISTVYDSNMIWNIGIDAEAGEAGIYTLYYAAFATSVSTTMNVVPKGTVVGGPARKWDAWETINFLEETGLEDNTPIPSAFLLGAAYGDDVFVLSMAAESSTTTGLLTVEPENSWAMTAMQGHEQAFLNINHSGGKFLAASSDGLLWMSDEGMEWTSVDPGISVRGAAYGDGLHVAVGTNGNVAWSANGLAWETTIVGSRDWRDVIHGQGRFVAVGGDIDNADAMASTDGLSWISTTVADDGPGLTSLVDLAHGDGRYCATMETDMIFCSGDGITWDVTDFDEKMILTGIAHGDGYTMAIGLMKDLNVVAFTSTDGAAWERSDPGSSEIPTGITYGGDRRFYVSGTSFLLMRTVDRTSGGGGGGGCSTLSAADEPLWPELILMVLTWGIFVRRRRKVKG